MFHGTRDFVEMDDEIVALIPVTGLPMLYSKLRNSLCQLEASVELPSRPDFFAVDTQLFCISGQVMIFWEFQLIEERFDVECRVFEFTKNVHCLCPGLKHEVLNLIPFLTSEAGETSDVADMFELEELALRYSLYFEDLDLYNRY